MEIKELQDLICQFRDARNWKQFHNPKDMALSLSLEASEVLELTQWKTESELTDLFKAEDGPLADELSDVLYWVLLMAHDFNVNLKQSLKTKLKKNEAKYPVDLAHNSNKKYGDFK